MKKFFRDVIFILLLVFFLISIIVFLGHNYTPINNNSYKQQYIRQHGKKISTLILGHSQASNGINPWVMGDSVFNAAESARIPYYDKELLVRNISRMPNLKIVIYPLIYQLEPGGFYTNDKIRWYSTFDYLITMGIYPPVKFKSKSLFYYNIGRFLGIKNYVNNIDCDSLGYSSLGNTFSNSKDFINIEVNEDSLLNDFRAIAKICKEHGVRFIIISTPCNNTFNLQVVDANGCNRIKRFIDSIYFYYPVEYMDYINHPDFRNSELYYSQTHLNNKGATMFSRRLKDDIGL